MRLIQASLVLLVYFSVTVSSYRTVAQDVDTSKIQAEFLSHVFETEEMWERLNHFQMRGIGEAINLDGEKQSLRQYILVTDVNSQGDRREIRFIDSIYSDGTQDLGNGWAYVIKGNQCFERQPLNESRSHPVSLEGFRKYVRPATGILRPNLIGFSSDDRMMFFDGITGDSPISYTDSLAKIKFTSGVWKGLAPNRLLIAECDGHQIVMSPQKSRFLRNEFTLDERMGFLPTRRRLLSIVTGEKAKVISDYSVFWMKQKNKAGRDTWLPRIVSGVSDRNFDYYLEWSFAEHPEEIFEQAAIDHAEQQRIRETIPEMQKRRALVVRDYERFKLEGRDGAIDVR